MLFNRFYQPDIDLEALEPEPRACTCRRSAELLLRLRWLAILLRSRARSLAVTGGVHDGRRRGEGGDGRRRRRADGLGAAAGTAPHLRLVLDELSDWMEEHEYESLAQMRGSMSLATCPDPAAYERANYMLMLQGRVE